MSLGTAMEAAVMAHVGVPQPALVLPADRQIRTYEDVRDVFGSNEEIAEAAGYGAPGQYRPGSPEWKRRKSFMRSLQRYEKRRTGAPGQSRGAGAARVSRLVTVAEINRTRANTPRTIRDVVRLMGMRGTTTSWVKVKFRYNSPKNPQRAREIAVKVYTHPEVYRDVDWPMRGRRPRTEEEWSDLGMLYLEAFAIAYGLPGELVADGTDGEDPIFTFTIGREEGIVYDFV